MHTSPLVTVYIPTKNRSRLLERAVNSVIDQNYKNIEIVVVDDGSTDDTQEVLSTIQKKTKLTVFKNERSEGACISRNKAILSASGLLVTGLDDDDFFSDSERISNLVNRWVQHSNEKYVYFDSVKVITAKGSIFCSKPKEVAGFELRTRNLIGSQVLAAKSLYMEAGLFDPEMPAWQDWDLWYRMGKIGARFFNIEHYSYTVDELHDAHRVTLGDDETIRRAMNRFSSKIEGISQNEKLELIHLMLGYPGVRPRAKELMLLIYAKRFGSLFVNLKRFFSR